MVLGSVADEHDECFAKDKEKRSKVNKNQLGEGQDVYLDKKVKG